MHVPTGFPSGMDTVDGYDSSTTKQIGMTILSFLFFVFFTVCQFCLFSPFLTDNSW